jgi:CRISPR/Cas system CMR subunit Cmr6 (Cas7 group RAMP superfamily)
MGQPKNIDAKKKDLKQMKRNNMNPDKGMKKTEKNRKMPIVILKKEEETIVKVLTRDLKRDGREMLPRIRKKANNEITMRTEEEMIVKVPTRGPRKEGREISPKTRKKADNRERLKTEKIVPKEMKNVEI